MFKNIITIAQKKGSQYFRFIPFNRVWETFFSSINKHFFIFEERKVAIVYFYNDETC